MDDRLPINQVPPRPIEFSLISEAFELIKPNWGNFALFTLISMIPVAIIVGIAYFGMFAAILATAGTSQNSDAMLAAIVPMYGGMFIMQFLIMAASAFMFGGLTRMVFVAMRGGRPEIQDGTAALQDILPLVGVALLIAFASMLGICACYVGSFIVIGFAFPAYAVFVNERTSVIDTARRCIELMKTDNAWVMGIVLYFVCSMIIGLSTYCCFVPALVTVPGYMAVATLAYRNRAGLAPFGVTGATNYPRESGSMNMPGYPSDVPPPMTPPGDAPPQNTEESAPPEDPTP